MLATLIVLAVALIHICILILEMVLWTRPRTAARFGMTVELAEQTKTLAANQGLYNGFLAAGLIWSRIADESVGYPVAIFFLLCVAVAGIYGALTASRSIILVQTAPALLALLLVLTTH